jgi:hypothetical protein
MHVHMLWEYILSGMLDFDFMVENKTSQKVGAIVLTLANGKTSLFDLEKFTLDTRTHSLSHTHTHTHTHTQKQFSCSD